MAGHGRPPLWDSGEARGPNARASYTSARAQTCRPPMNVRTGRRSRSSRTTSASVPGASAPTVRQAKLPGGVGGAQPRGFQWRHPQYGHEVPEGSVHRQHAAGERAVVQQRGVRHRDAASTQVREGPARQTRAGRPVGDRDDPARPFQLVGHAHGGRVHVVAVADQFRRRRRRTPAPPPSSPGSRCPSGVIRLKRCVAWQAPAAIPATRLLVVRAGMPQRHHAAPFAKRREAGPARWAVRDAMRDDADVAATRGDHVEDVLCRSSRLPIARTCACSTFRVPGGNTRQDSGCAPR